MYTHTQTTTGKRIVLVDDSIVRGNTMTLIVKLLKQSGAKEVNVTSSLPYTSLCHYVINNTSLCHHSLYNIF